MSERVVRPKLSVRRVPFQALAGPRGRMVPTAAGDVVEEPLPDEVARREEAMFGTGTRPKVDPPSWFLELGRRGATPSEVIDVLRDQLPEIRDLRQAQLVVNELGRLEEAGEVISRAMTQDIINSLQAR